jgi:hypothetical protein
MRDVSPLYACVRVRRADTDHQYGKKEKKKKQVTNKLHGLSPRAIYTDRATADCERS